MVLDFVFVFVLFYFTKRYISITLYVGYFLNYFQILTDLILITP